MRRVERTPLRRDERAVDWVALHGVLLRLTEFHPQLALLAELRCLGGLSRAECAEVMHEPLRTLERGWPTAQAWLGAEIE